jgi:hypothetical protein
MLKIKQHLVIPALQNYYYYLFTAIGFAPGGSGPYTTQLQQKTYNINNKKQC